LEASAPLQGQFGRRWLCSLRVVFIAGGSRQWACPEFAYKANRVYVLFIPSDVCGVCQYATADKVLCYCGTSGRIGSVRMQDERRDE
jgi:hypothetical protein